MSYTRQYFGKELNELRYEDIEDFFFDSKDESDKIEFKSYYNLDEGTHREKESGVIRAICGLLNSEGGIIIWGAPIGQIVTGKKEKIFQGSLSPVDKLIEKDSFISRVTDLITPSPKGIKFQHLEKEGDNIYIIEVDQSFYSPHQFRNIYYMRIDGQTRPAPHHYIEALFRKVTFPRLQGYIKINSIKSNGDGCVVNISNIIFNMSKLQNEEDIYYRVIVTIGKFTKLGGGHGGNMIYTSEGHELTNFNAKETLYYNEPLTNSEDVVFNNQELMENNYKCEIFFYFGGKKSPLMTSKYELNLGNPFTKDMNNLFSTIDENQHIYETGENIEITDAERITMIVGR